MSGKDSRIYVGNLPPDVRTKDIEDLFQKYGKIVYLDLKNRKGPPFAFLEYEDPRYGYFIMMGFDSCPIHFAISLTQNSMNQDHSSNVYVYIFFF